MNKDKKIDFITKKHIKQLNMEIAHELDFFDYEDEFTSLQNKFVGGNTTDETIDIFRERL
ncbi:hypothetical protein [Tepidibacter formicigenes]|jgi:hypothetical protein|uniref:Uncharacterized protein n=1 Tax=Tepidibacter formicigenes DSM 15518 TaxID=1123349 RepID=A0A1M6M8E5_9FIRM|nr:hypothetical protein [Tepidibacter formicigenes]SHJ79711.1 hypothetical protein SAMN02744037_00851 [Tepidibacter formicigenes DSM 15518]